MSIHFVFFLCFPKELQQINLPWLQMGEAMIEMCNCQWALAQMAPSPLLPLFLLVSYTRTHRFLNPQPQLPPYSYKGRRCNTVGGWDSRPTNCMCNIPIKKNAWDVYWPKTLIDLLTQTIISRVLKALKKWGRCDTILICSLNLCMDVYYIVLVIMLVIYLQYDIFG